MQSEIYVPQQIFFCLLALSLYGIDVYTFHFFTSGDFIADDVMHLNF
jgi:hypothetical protein